MSGHARYWQVRAAYPRGAMMMFGVQAGTRETAAERARKIAPGSTGMTITRLYGRHHPLRATAGREEKPDAG